MYIIKNNISEEFVYFSIINNKPYFTKSQWLAEHFNSIVEAQRKFEASGLVKEYHDIYKIINSLEKQDWIK